MSFKGKIPRLIKALLFITLILISLTGCRVDQDSATQTDLDPSEDTQTSEETPALTEYPDPQTAGETVVGTIRGTYNGKLVDGIPHGFGTWEADDGVTYTGEFYEGLPHGQGELKLLNGWSYKGAFNRGYRHGQGRLKYPNGDQYEGEFSNNIIHGWGTFTYADGTIKEGLWHEGEYLEGQGRAVGTQEDPAIIADGDYLLALVSKETSLKSDYIPADLQLIPANLKPPNNMYLRGIALEHLQELWAAAAQDGVNLLMIRSAYRSYSTQIGLFENYASKYGIEEANRFSARPGQSEHQLGTTVDFGGTAVDLTAAYADTEQGRWLAENAYRFGFVMSYPAEKEEITGYIFEPWHYRFIGVEAAAEWKESGKTLKEFLERKPQNYE